MDYDFVIIGAGSAGCILANRLSADPTNQVLLLEAGGPDRHPWIHIPAGFQKLLNHPRLNWNFETEPEDNVRGRRISIPRGKVLGGSSSINGMLHVRGQQLDYDTWAQLGNRGWSFDDVLPYFKKSERFARGDTEVRGHDGAVQISDMVERHELIDAFIDAGVECGYPHNPDYNGADQEGFGYYQVAQRDGRRESAAVAYLHPIKYRKNLTIQMHAHVTSLVIDAGRVTGVRYTCKGEDLHVGARASVVLSAGAVQSPQILELSGIGAPVVLAAASIECTHALKGVGENYRDHYAARFNWRINQPISLNQQSRGWRLAAEVLRYGFVRRGMLTFTAGIGHGFVRSREGLASPDCQFFFTHASFGDAGTRALETEPGITLAAYQCRPESQGTIHIGSNDPLAAPLIRPNFLSNPNDQAALIGGLRVARQVGEASPLARYCEFEMNPGKECDDDAALLEYARNTGTTTYHVMGTCKMGTENDPMAVVDERLRLRGLHGLRVIDASVMPTMPSGNINAPVLMVAEKGAQMLLEDVA